MKHCLYEPIVIASNLPQKQAAKVLSEANKMPAAKHFRISMTSNTQKDLWNVIAYPLYLEQEFMKNPHDWVFEIENEK